MSKSIGSGRSLLTCLKHKQLVSCYLALCLAVSLLPGPSRSLSIGERAADLEDRLLRVEVCDNEREELDPVDVRVEGTRKGCVETRRAATAINTVRQVEVERARGAGLGRRGRRAVVRWLDYTLSRSHGGSAPPCVLKNFHGAHAQSVGPFRRSTSSGVGSMPSGQTLGRTPLPGREERSGASGGQRDLCEEIARPLANKDACCFPVPKRNCRSAIAHERRGGAVRHRRRRLGRRKS